MASVSAIGLMRKTMTLAVIRGGAMCLLLLSITLTYSVLSPQGFALFNLGMFLISVASAICQPFNRTFWVSKSPQTQTLSYNAAAIITMFTVSLGMGTAMLLKAHQPVFAMVGALAAGVYSVCRIVERYTYGKLLLAGFSGIAVLPIALFAALDFSAAAMLLYLDIDNIVVRFVTPSVAFLICLLCVVGVWPNSEFRINVETLPRQLTFMRHELLSKTGAKFIIVGCLLSAAAMIDRPIIYFVPIVNEDFSAAYLLALSYSVAMQTLLYLLFDMARAHVFHDGSWQQNARKTAALILLMAFATAALGAVSYPLLVWLGLLPKVIEWWLWAALLAKALVIALAAILNVDRFQRGQIRQIALAVCTMLMASLIAIGSIYQGFSQNSAALVLLLMSGATAGVMTANLFARVPR